MENAVSVNEVSRIAAGTLFKGEIQSPGDIRIDGGFGGHEPSTVIRCLDGEIEVTREGKGAVDFL